jgi:hypothetical protein
MNTSIARRSASLVLSFLALRPAVSADESGAGAGSTDAWQPALKERPGSSTVEGTAASEERYQISIVNSKGKIADVCVASAWQLQVRRPDRNAAL